MNPQPICRVANRQFLFRALFSSRLSARTLGNVHFSSRLVQPTAIRCISERRRFGDFDNVDWEVSSNSKTRNPLDYVQNHRRDMAQRHYRMKRIRIAAAGAILCVLAQVAIMMMYPAESRDDNEKSGEKGEGRGEDNVAIGVGNLLPRDRADAPDDVNKEFQGKTVKVVAGGARIVAEDERTGEEVELVETGTSTVPHFPKTISLPTGAKDTAEEYALLGLGIRTVSFLSVQVYVVGLYVATDSLSRLQADLVKAINPIASALIPGEKAELRNGLLDGEKSYEIWNRLLKEKSSDVKSVWRIVPVRNTDFAHLRDGWVRGITSKTQAGSASKEKEQFSDESFGLAMRDFKALFGGKGRAPKGSVVLLARDGAGKLGVMFQEKGQTLDFGVISDERIARLIWLGYLGGKTVSSEGARKGVVDGIMELVERPIGSIETKVS